MRPIDAARALLPHLVAWPAFQHPSFRVEIDTAGGLAVHFQGRFWGTWNWNDGAYRWAPAPVAGVLTERRVAVSAAEVAQTSAEMLGGALPQLTTATDDIWVGTPGPGVTPEPCVG